MSGASVSIVTRTLGRDCLAEAAAAVAAQDHPRLEWVVVDAAGRGLAAPGAGAVPVRVVSTGQRLPRSRAANAGLDAAHGERLLVLDDDDLIAPGHVARLSATLDARPDAGAAYSDWEAEEAPGRRVGGYAPEFSALLLARGNLFPPHAVLFDARLVREGGCRFDEELEYFEDWDFWLALAARGAFVRSPGCTASYRTWLSQSGIHDRGGASADPRLERDHARVRAKHRAYIDRAGAEQAARLAAARAAADARDLARAAALWSEAHAADPQDAEPVVGYAEVALAAGDAGVARATLDRARASAARDPALARRVAALAAALDAAPPPAVVPSGTSPSDPTP